ncbi:class I SAM-dependent methyltransferase [archaeon]|nr:class I SAM-dependent methyltransferase [archaeon]MBL7057202.1 class I SAM-dependent methyltransferase [Candidatus Woesearchaeota archaeon]
MIDKNLYKKPGLYDKALKFIGFERGLNNFINRLKIDCPEDCTILDLGCGTGIVGLQLIKKISSSTLLATDIEETFLNETMKNAKERAIEKNRISVGILDISNPTKTNLSKKLKPNSFDIVCMGGSLGYSKNQEDTLKVLSGLIKKGGYLINIEMNENFFGKLIGSKYNYKPICLKKLVSRISNEGFEVSTIKFSIKDFPANLTRIGIIARRNDRK